MSFDEKRWAGHVIAVGVLAVGLTCLVNGALRVGQPFPGFLIAHDGIVMSIGRGEWSGAVDPRIPFSQVVDIVGAPVADAGEIAAYTAGLRPGDPVTYRFRKAGEVFTAAVPVRLFTTQDFLALYGNYFLVGLTFALAGLWALLRLGPQVKAVFPFFLMCESSAFCLLMAGDVYGPYWFTLPYLAVQCVVPATALHFAALFPEPLGGRAARVAALAVIYAGSALLAAAMIAVADSPALFLPLLYTVYLLLANSILLLLGRLLISRSSNPDPTVEKALDIAIAAVLVALLMPAVIFVIYPVIEGFISPLVLVAPLVSFPLLTAVALRRLSARARPVAPVRSVRLRLSFLFLAAVETAFLAGIAYFWLSISWQQVLDDLALYHQQKVRVEHIRGEAEPSADDLRQLEEIMTQRSAHRRVRQAREALERGDLPALASALEGLAGHYAVAGARLDARRRWLGRINAALVIALVLVGILQAVVFTMAVRRWLIRPIDHLAEDTAVIATGDLAHRSRFDASAEFASLAQSINAMAASLGEIQERVNTERTARELAAAAARDGERRRLARELHDGILQDLSAVKLAAEAEARRRDHERMQDIVDGLIRTIVSLRHVVDDLRPQDLSHASLGAAIGSHARALAQGQDLQVDLDLGQATAVADWAALDVYRIAQEAITNAVRHGSPTRLRVRIARHDEETILEVSDDGVGFDPAAAVRGSGLASMSERAAAIGARLQIRAWPGRGATVSVAIPRSPSAPPPPVA